jgi:ABC-type multidrug transport system fused ATPase/permease subunit
MNFIHEEIFKLVDDTYIENLLKLILIERDMCESDKKMIEILIQNDKNFNFKRIKYLFTIELSANFGYFADRVNDRVIFKLSTAFFTILNRNILSKTYNENEKNVIINLEKTCFEEFNKNTVSVILKNIEKNKNNDDSFIQNVYLESYNNILMIFENYTLIIQKLFNFITELILLLLTPFFFDQRHGVIRSTFNIFFVIGYLLSEFFFIFKELEKEDDNNGKNSENFEVKNNIINVFRNINTIIENNTLKKELSGTLNNIIKLLRNDNFRKQYELNKTKNKYVKEMNKYKIVETLGSLIVNDAYLFNLTAASELAMQELGERLVQLNKKLPMVRDFTKILLHVDPYYTAETLLWNYDTSSENIFTLKNVTIEHQEDNIINIVLENINLNFENKKSHFIYGNSGSGKTTLLNALMKRMKIKNGSIMFFGSDYTYFSIRAHLSYITSENALFSKSLYYNITYGLDKKIILEKKNKIMTKIIEYMNLFRLEKFISNMRTKNATKLSKGQTQRVAILRLFIHIIFNDKKILFLDEFTSNIDNEVEKIIFTELRNLQKIYPFTVFYISHNLYNKKYSDYIYEINTDTRSINKKITAEYENECE